MLVDVGASGAPPEVWRTLAPTSVYVGFDPDLAEAEVNRLADYRGSFVFNQAVTDVAAASVEFHVTRSPHCSSTLEPDLAALDRYLFADLFAVERRAVVPAVRLDAALGASGLDRVHWLKVDTQGTDLRIFASLPTHIRERVLAVDIEPGLVPAYRGEDDFAATHRVLLEAGFWPSTLRPLGAPRLRRATVAEVARRHPDLPPSLVEAAVGPSPVWVEARYLRDLDSLASDRFEPADYAALWAFAMADGQPGFALDLTLAYEGRFGRDALGEALRQETVDWLRAYGKSWTHRRRSFWTRIASAIPPSLRRWASRRND